MFPVRLHAVTALGALDRRRMEENFFFWADRINNIEDYSIARKTVTRDRMTIDAVEDIWGNPDHTGTFGLMQSPILANSATSIESGESAEMVLDWSCDLKIAAGAANAYFARIVPFAAGQLLWEGSDILQLEWPLTDAGGGSWLRNTAGGRSMSSDGTHSLNGRAYFSAPTGKFDVGLVAAPETTIHLWREAEFDISNVNLAVRKPY